MENVWGNCGGLNRRPRCLVGCCGGSVRSVGGENFLKLDLVVRMVEMNCGGLDVFQIHVDEALGFICERKWDIEKG